VKAADFLLIRGKNALIRGNIVSCNKNKNPPGYSY
jgi:hypothetical protein